MNGINPNGGKQLPQVFKELQQARNEQSLKRQAYISKSIYKKIKEKIDLLTNKKEKDMYYENYYDKSRKQSLLTTLQNKYSYYFNNTKAYIPDIKNAKTKTISIAIIILVLSLIIVTSLTNYILATDVDVETQELASVGDFESNENTIDLMQILSDNISATQRKEIITQERIIEYDTVYQENNNLPKYEEIIIQEGKEGKEEVTIIRTFENDEIVEENIINANRIEDCIEQIIEIGTSELLAEYQVHLEDSMYVIEETILRESADNQSNELCIINKSFDVKLLEISEEWCKVGFEDYEGYVKTDILTSAFKNPEIVEECRIYKILAKVNLDMKLNTPSGLTLEDFKKVLSGESKDENMIFASNAEVFYNMEQNYNINGIFLASVGIHESAWGTSRISLEKKNLFGYGAYDRDPYSFSFVFETYEDGIELLAKVFAKYYLNPNGTEIYDGEVASGSYYNGATVSGVNVRYASDQNWGTKVYTIMEYLYGKL